MNNFFLLQIIAHFLLQKIMFSSDSLIEVLEETTPTNSKLIRKGKFDMLLRGRLYQEVLCFLYENFIMFNLKSDGNAQKQYHLLIKFNFQLLFEPDLLKPQDFNRRQLRFIKLQRQKIVLTIQTEKNQQQLFLWRQYLQKHLNQKGFHESFNAIKKIGKGSFASVYLVEKKENKKRYAVKAFSKQSIFSEEKGKQSLINEIEVMRRLNHKNLMKLFGVYQTENSIYLILELLAGGQLSQKLNKKQQLTALEVKNIMKCLLEGLEAMHKKNIMHRDIKPDNILFRKDNDYDCIIADFGLAQSSQLEQFLFVRCGTPGFVAPQIACIKDHKTKYTCACDLFSVGVIFHMLLLKKSPFKGIQNDIIRQRRTFNLQLDGIQYKILPKSSLNLLQKLLEVNPQLRITATEALKHQFFRNELSLFQKQQKSHILKIEPKLLKNNRPCFMAAEVEALEPRWRNIEKIKLPKIREESCLKINPKQDALKRKFSQLSSSPANNNQMASKQNDKTKARRSRSSLFRKQGNQL